METTKLGPLNVTRLCLGTMLMGDKTPPDEAHRMLDRFVAAGGNFIDTADTYIDGESERTLAPWLAGHRDEVVVATKVRFAVSDPGGEGLAPDRIRAACDASLKRLGIDVIDLYQVHAPDPSVPLEETLEALDGLVRAGKVRAIGASNYPAWLLAWAVALQDRNGWAPFVSLQPQYSLVERWAGVNPRDGSALPVKSKLPPARYSRLRGRLVCVSANQAIWSYAAPPPGAPVPAAPSNTERRAWIKSVGIVKPVDVKASWNPSSRRSMLKSPSVMRS
jgi:hypothetical protein